jgi:hypothetical protein
MKRTQRKINKTNRKRISKNRKLTQKSGGLGLSARLFGTLEDKKKKYKFNDLIIKDVSDIFTEEIKSQIISNLVHTENKVELAKLLKVIFNYYEHSSKKEEKTESTIVKIENLKKNAIVVYFDILLVIGDLKGDYIKLNDLFDDIGCDDEEKDKLYLFIAEFCGGLNEVLTRYDGFVWDFDDTLATNKTSKSGLLSLIDTSGLTGEELKECFFQPEVFVKLVIFLVKNGKKIGIISFGRKTNIKQILGKLFSYYGFESPFNLINIYGSDDPKKSVAGDIIQKRKLNFITQFTKEHFGSIDDDIPKRILFFDDDYNNTYEVSKYDFMGVSLIGKKSYAVGLMPLNKSSKPGFFIGILFLINELGGFSIPYDLLFQKNPGLIHQLSIESNMRRKERQREITQRKSTTTLAQRKPSEKRQHLPEERINSNNNSTSASKKPRTQRKPLPSRGWSNSSSNNNTPPPPLPPRSGKPPNLGLSMDQSYGRSTTYA